MLMDKQPFRGARRFSSIQGPGPPLLLTCLSLIFPICSVGGAPQLSQLLGDKEHPGRGKGNGTTHLHQPELTS